MSNPAKLFEEALFEHHQWRAVSPWGMHQVGCLDLFTKRSESEPLSAWISKYLLSCLSSEKPLLKPISVMVPQGSMLDPRLMSSDCKWFGGNLPGHLKEGLRDLKDPKIPKPALHIFDKKTLPPLSLSWKVSGGSSVWLMGFAGLELNHDDTLTCIADGLEAASVDVATVGNWVSSPGEDGKCDWFPDLDKLLQRSTDWKMGGDVKRLWIVTEVLTATEFTLKGRDGLFANVSTKVPTGVPGLNASLKISLHKSSDSEMVVKAARKTRFPIASKLMRVDYNVRNRKVEVVRAPEEADLRGDDGDHREKSLEMTKEDMFEVNKDGESVPIPLLTLTEQELDNLGFT